MLAKLASRIEANNRIHSQQDSRERAKEKIREEKSGFSRDKQTNAPTKCSYCKFMGHSSVECRFRIRDEKKNIQFKHSNNPSITKESKPIVRCVKCGVEGHYANTCTKGLSTSKKQIDPSVKNSRGYSLPQEKGK